jgi:hypothetical protein
MKKSILVLVAALTAFSASAEDIAFVTNEAGGRVVITSYDCTVDGKSFKNLMRAYAVNKQGRRINGCYRVVESSETIHVVWESGDEYTYDIKDFETFTKSKPKKPAQKL